MHIKVTFTLYCRLVCFFFKILFIFRGRGRERERGRETLIGCLLHTPQLGTGPATQACALTGNRTSDLLLCGTVLNQLSHTGQGYCRLLRVPIASCF